MLSLSLAFMGSETKSRVCTRRMRRLYTMKKALIHAFILDEGAKRCVVSFIGALLLPLATLDFRISLFL